MSPSKNIPGQTSQASALEGRLSHWVSEWLSTQKLAKDFRVVPLAGDGSPRPFFRIETGSRHYVLLTEPAWILSKDYPPHQAFLKKHGLPVPEFLAVDPKQGALLMEDLGDELLQQRLLKDPSHRESWLEKATLLLAQLHGATFPVPQDLPVHSRAFDAAKYTQELEFTLEHLHSGLLKLPKLPDNAHSDIARFAQSLEKFGPLAFSHRDYHTRNILVHEEKLRLIDFQDARMGPVEYDLASLFFDAYVPIDEKTRAHLLAIYRKALSIYPLGSQIDWNTFEARLERVALQRVVKAAGSFASFYMRYGKATHLPYLVPALESAIALRKKHPNDLKELPLDLWLAKSKEWKE